MLRQLSREAGAVRLCDLDPASGALTIECRPCNRHGRYRLKTLIEAHGPRAGLPELRRVVVSGGGCRSSIDPPRPCHARYPRIEKRAAEEKEHMMPKEQKTAEELDELLHEEMEMQGPDRRLAGDGQWLKIIPLKGDEGTNWTVSHGPKGNPPGPFERAIQDVLPGLQEKYDLKDTDGT